MGFPRETDARAAKLMDELVRAMQRADAAGLDADAAAVCALKIAYVCFGEIDSGERPTRGEWLEACAMVHDLWGSK